ncbi:alpha/beta hydrolase [Antrihabitans sp. YC3-6]|uniref:Alpha/beta hydrolase n=1 Tax=Antrihabitans stalagmiti TaxID=2799499 RepID=A0A934NR42_9NOCA|nr:alpha/beta hydrolase [Antrihabitans stalagmiti]
MSVFAGPSRRSRALRFALQLTVRPVLQLWGAVPNLPWPYGLIDVAATPLRPIRGTKSGPVDLPDCSAEWIAGPGAADDRALLYLHGGAFICCGLRTHRRMVSGISRACAAPALSVGYRMLPETPASTGLEDCVAGYEWLLAQGYAGDRIAIVGDSAGGWFALMTALAARARGLGDPGAIVLISPLVDTDPGRKLVRLGDVTDPLFPANALVSMMAMLADVEGERGQLDEYGRVPSPLHVDLTGLPPVLVQAGADELLVVDAEQIAAELSAAGVVCRLQLFEGQFHVFQAAADLLPEAAKAVVEIGEFVRSTIID